MLSTDDAAKVYDTILSTPGMNETVKIDLKVTRKNALLLATVIERGLSVKDDDKPNLLKAADKDSLNELTAVSVDCLQKAGLTELHEKLKSLNSKQ